MKWDKGSFDPRVRSYPACENELKKNLSPWEVAHSFKANPSRDRGIKISEFKSSLFYRANSNTAKLR